MNQHQCDNSEVDAKMQILSTGVMRSSKPGLLACSSLGSIIKLDFSDTNAGLRKCIVLTIMGLCLLIALSFAQSQECKSVFVGWGNKEQIGEKPITQKKLPTSKR